MKIDYNKLFAFGDGFIRGALTVAPEKEAVDDEAIIRAECLPRVPLVFRHHLGKRPYDLIGTGYAGMYLLSERVLQSLQDQRCSGWTIYPVKIYDKKKTQVQGYHGFSVTGRSGPIDWSMGRKERRPPVVPGGPEFDVWVGYYFDPKKWDGSDVFCPEGTTHTIVTEAVKIAIEEISATNIQFERLTECERTWPLPGDT